MGATCAIDSKKMRTEDRRQRTDGEVSCWRVRDKKNQKKYLFFSIFGEKYLRIFLKRTFEMQRKVNRKNAQKGTKILDAGYSQEKTENEGILWVLKIFQKKC